MAEICTPFEILDFWWRAGPGKWWARNDKFDKVCQDRFGATYEAAISGDLDHWAETVPGVLALILLLDQFSRNLNRGSAKAFQFDPKALALSREAVARGWHLAYPEPARSFFYLPMMHAEDMEAQEHCVDLARTSGEDSTYKAALEHMDIIRRFGRFPHRNTVLGRDTTEAEHAYLESGGFSG